MSRGLDLHSYEFFVPVSDAITQTQVIYNVVQGVTIDGDTKVAVIGFSGTYSAIGPDGDQVFAQIRRAYQSGAEEWTYLNTVIGSAIFTIAGETQTSLIVFGFDENPNEHGCYALLLNKATGGSDDIFVTDTAGFALQA